MLKFPTDCVTASERTEYCYRAQELLRLVHNIFGKWFRGGISQVEYDSLPKIVKVLFPYKDNLTKEDWDKFQQKIFEPMNIKIVADLLINRDLLKKSTRFTLTSLDDIQEVE